MVIRLRRHGDTEPSPSWQTSLSTSPWPDVHLPSFVTIRLLQSVNPSLFTLWVVVCQHLDSWLTPPKSPQTNFSVAITGFLHCTVSISRQLLKNLSKKKSNKQLLCTNTTIYGVWSATIFFLF